MKARIVPNLKYPAELKRCPFCGSRCGETDGVLGTGLEFIVCTNYDGCGATISFDNPDANRKRKPAREFFNRRAKGGAADEV